MKVLAWIVGVPLSGLVALLLLGTLVKACENPEAAAAARHADAERCAKALMSSTGTSTHRYADKQAYDQHVADNCKGFDLKR